MIGASVPLLLHKTAHFDSRLGKAFFLGHACHALQKSLSGLWERLDKHVTFPFGMFSSKHQKLAVRLEMRRLWQTI